MKIRLTTALLGILASGCATSQPHNQMAGTPVVVTTYWSEGAGSDKWSRQEKSASGEKLKEGITVAVDPRLWDYGTQIYIEGLGVRVAEDTGRWVRSRKAAKRRGLDCPVIDVYFRRRVDALIFAREFEAKYGGITFASAYM